MKEKRFEFLYVFSAVIFSIIMYRCNVFSDDVNKMYIGECSLGACWDAVKLSYSTWSSRFIINFLIYYFTGGRKLLWAIAMGISMYILQKSLRVLFVKEDDPIGNWMILSFVFAFPYMDISTAGWIATTTTYFLPVAFGFAALIPIKKYLSGEKIRFWEYSVYLICAIIAGNNEQYMAVLLACYSIAMVYFGIRRRFPVYLFVMFLSSIVSAIYTCLCPGNYARKETEIPSWFPTFEMMDLKDKFDVGFSTTIRYLFFQTNVPVIFLCIIFAVLIWKKYEDSMIRTIAVIPVSVTLIMGPLYSLISQVFRSFYLFKKDLSIYGLFTPENAGTILPLVEFAIGAITLGALIIEVFLLSNTIEAMISAFVLVGAGVVGRVIIGFSPTVWGSGYRTCAVMEFCILAAGVLLVSANQQLFEEHKQAKEKVLIGCRIMYVLCIMNLALLVYEITI